MSRVVLILLLLCAACGARTAETRDPRMVVCAWISGPDGFNPVVSVSAASTMAEALIFTPLVDIGANLLPNWSTSLAYRVDVDEGGTRYRLHLRRHARWSDGVALTAKDVVFSIRLNDNPSVIAGHSADFALMRSIRALNDDTVEIVLKSPSPPFLQNALSQAIPLPEHILHRYPPESPQEAAFVNADAGFSQHPVISGPWRIERYVPDAYLILARNPNYWGAPPFLAHVAFRVYPQQDSLYAAVDAGEVDVTDIAPNLWRVHGRLRGDHAFINWPWNVTFMLLPNYRDPGIAWIRDTAVKRAMMYAIDRSFITHGIMSGQADLLNGPVPTFSPYYDRAVVRYRYDPPLARAVLERAGWHLRGGVRRKGNQVLRFSLKTGGATDAVAVNVGELIQANLRAVGIDCVLQNEELQTFFTDLHNSRFQMALRGRILYPFPDDYAFYDSSQTRANGGYNVGFYSNPAIDRAIQAARTAPSLAAARAALNRYQEAAAVDLPAIYLYSVRLGAVVPKNLRGLELTPNSPAALPMGLQFWRYASVQPRTALLSTQ